ncbi:asparagine synthase-related protein [Bacillus haimaensis]|uniref:asparagine synthase-related protein n=1 Tax=Bacillus haimaensis TaxID=3160967 RepID=UPI003AA82E2C
MSAITGIFNTNDSFIPKGLKQILENSLSIFPSDRIHYWSDNNVFIGCHMQWVTPESISEQIPYYNSERRLAITADAIIDNRKQLFDLLQIQVQIRKSITDSELILLAYQKWGEDVSKHLIGDFAFVIWDEKNQKLFASRDFSGSRTLYYSHKNNMFSFCTIMQPLLCLPFVNESLNEDWLSQYIAISSVIDVVDTSSTIYKEIHQLPPSHNLILQNSKLRLSRYSNLYNIKKRNYKNKSDYVEEFMDVFTEAVNCRLRTFKNVGAHLSGGLDSGAVVSVAQGLLNEEKKNLHTFSYLPPNDFQDFSTSKYRIADERPFIETTINHIPNLKENFLNFENDCPYNEIDDFLDIMESPYKFFENSIWLKGIYEQAAKNEIGVLLNGGRGNLSISWGPALEFYGLLFKRFHWRKLNKELSLYSRNMEVHKSEVFPYVLKFAFPYFKSPINNVKTLSLINPNFAKRTGVYTKLESYGLHYDASKLPNIFEERKKHFGELYHWNATNTLSSKLSLRYGLWKRDPTNDLRLVKFCLSVPDEECVKDGLDRALIRRALKEKLPDTIRLNQLYRGVQGVDWVHRMKNSWPNFTNELESMKKNGYIFQYINKEVLEVAIKKVKEGPITQKAIDPYYRIAIRSLIINRFISRIEGR